MDCLFVFLAIVSSAVALLVLYAVVSLIVIATCCCDVPTALTPKLGNKQAPFAPGSVVWITGAGSGLGERMAYILAETSEHVKIILSSRKEANLENVAQECRRIHREKFGGGATDKKNDDDNNKPPLFQVKILPLDMSDLESIPAKVQQAKLLFSSGSKDDDNNKKPHKIDVLINGAGVTTRSYCSDSDFALDEYVCRVNYLGPICLVKQLFPDLPAVIIQLGSIASKLGAPVRSAYSGSKFALHGWLEALGVESVLQGREIYILNCILGSIDTGLGSRALTNVNPKDGSIVTLQQDDQNIDTGLDPQYVTERILAVAKQQKRYETWIAKPKELLPILYFVTYCRHTAFLVITKTLGRKYAVTKKEG